MLNVAVQVEAPPHTAAAAVDFVSDSCEKLLGSGRCPGASSVVPPQVVAWVAIVRAEQAAPTEVQIEFRDWVERGVLIQSRELRFAPEDALESRWAAVGTAIAAFVAARDTAGTPPLEQPAPVSPPKLSAPAPQVSSSGWGGDFLFWAARGLEGGGPRWGGVARGWVAFGPPLAGAPFGASFRYAQSPGEPEIAWWSVGVGPGVRLGRGELYGEFYSEVGYERLLVAASDPAGSESAVVGRFGGRFGAQLVGEVARPLALVAGAEAALFRPSIDVRVAGAQEGRVPALSYGFMAGIRLTTD